MPQDQRHERTKWCFLCLKLQNWGLALRLIEVKKMKKKKKKRKKKKKKRRRKELNAKKNTPNWRLKKQFEHHTSAAREQRSAELV